MKQMKHDGAGSCVDTLLVFQLQPADIMSLTYLDSLILTF